MHMKQRHQAERDIAGAERVSRGDVARGGRQIAMAQGHALRQSGAAAGVQDQRDIVRAGFGRAAGAADLWRDGGNAGLLGRTPGVGRGFGWQARNHQHLGVGVREIKTKLLELVARMERRGGTGSGGRQKRDDSV